MVTKDYAGNLLVYPKTIDNNGFFQCLIDKTNYNKKKGHKKSETIRSALGMEKDVKISFQEMPIIVDYFSKLLKKQLLWREFYYHCYIDFPESLEWDKQLPEAKLDSTAPDIVKACYNQLNETGFLHNRGRMILAHYLVHYKKIYWKSCDKMYATRLVDYDPFVNIGNWNFIKKQPKFKWLKPEVQYKKWDKGCTDNIKPGDYTKMYT